MRTARLNEIKPDAYGSKVGWIEDDVQKLKRKTVLSLG